MGDFVSPALASALANVASSATSVTLRAANAARRGLAIFNDSTSDLYVAFSDAAASTSNFTIKMAAGSYYEMPVPAYNGKITGIWTAANGNARITETT